MQIDWMNPMTNGASNADKPKQEFKACPQCGRKGLYHIKQQYYRCRYCGTYLIHYQDKDDPNKPG
jgi:ribosomal protein L37AE/L43A